MCDDDITSKNLQRRYLVARKPHACYACGEAITAGSRYHFDVEICDGSLQSFKHCVRCWKMVEALWRTGIHWVDFSLACGEIWDDPPPEVAALAFALPGEVSP